MPACSAPQACAVGLSPPAHRHAPPLPSVRVPTIAVKYLFAQERLLANPGPSALPVHRCRQQTNLEMQPHLQGKAGPWRGNVCFCCLNNAFAFLSVCLLFHYCLMNPLSWVTINVILTDYISLHSARIFYFFVFV